MYTLISCNKNRNIIDRTIETGHDDNTTGHFPKVRFPKCEFETFKVEIRDDPPKSVV